MSEICPDYPSSEEVDAWCEELLSRTEGRSVEGRQLDSEVYDFKLGVRHTSGVYVAFESPGAETFYGFWQPAPSGKGPILFHLPGYGAEMSAHPELVSSGFNVLHVNPLGYATPDGPATDRQVAGVWPVMPDTAASLGRKGYVDWLSDAILAVRWGLAQQCVEADRFAFFGSSQGGGTSLLLASIFRDRGVRCVATDVPAFINVPSIGSRNPCQREALLGPIDRIAAERPADLPAAWKALGYVDPLNHAHRLTMPVLLTAGAVDTTCLPENIRALFDVLPGTRSYTEIEAQAHGYTRHFLQLARAWFLLHV
jgi:cephalosporin-C deacetylase-like acetyl esterase